ncbi:helix-turn-helix transcriptional regulator [Moraxella sp. ZY210820]|uniref:helix-turn-helix domain-containing protein n=1 Tax=unclassified Moraxella TaxID=2685852 RepID=UPI0027315301|nr:helix-turn-helix transcriptional regulator [Moraxella sp. ZY210820]WLF83246.1 helix-turn-helix domain-containing protein [Moraxella sp. ZY210820]
MKKYVIHQERMASLDPARRERIQNRVNNTLVAIRLAELRKNAKLSQQELANKIGISQSAISQIENTDSLELITLFTYVGALGGKLHLSVEMPSGEILNLT